MKERLKRLKTWVWDSEVRIAFAALIGTAIVLFFVSVFFDKNISFPKAPNLGVYNHPDFWENVLVESHGMLLDLFIIGVFIFWLQRRSNEAREKKRLIQRYKEELDDYRGWTEGEAAYRVAGIIRRLLKEEVELNKDELSNLHLGRCSNDFIVKAIMEMDGQMVSLQGADLIQANLQEADLVYLNLQGADLNGANLQGAKLMGTNLQDVNLMEASLQYADLMNASLQGANLVATNLQGANLDGANLDGANLIGANLLQVRTSTFGWIQDLKDWNIKGIEWVEGNYYVDPRPVKVGVFTYFVIKGKEA